MIPMKMVRSWESCGRFSEVMVESDARTWATSSTKVRNIILEEGYLGMNKWRCIESIESFECIDFIEADRLAFLSVGSMLMVDDITMLMTYREKGTA